MLISENILINFPDATKSQIKLAIKYQEKFSLKMTRILLLSGIIFPISPWLKQ